MYPSFYEYYYTGELNEKMEEITKNIINNINLSMCTYNLVKYYDTELGENKKNRTFYFTSPLNINTFIYNSFFTNCDIKMEVYYKQRII